MIEIIVKATLVVMLALLVVQLMRTARASRRFVVLASAFATLAALPVAVIFAPTIPVVVRESRQFITTMPAAPVGERAASVRPEGATVPADGAQAAPPRRGMATIPIAVWSTGVAISLIPVLATLRRLRRLRRTARMCSMHKAQGTHVRVLVHDDLRAPVTFGLIRPVVLLPGDAETWTNVEVERALVHELEHVRRRDWPMHVLARLVCAVYWFHPLVWQAWRQLHLEADRACDDAVVSGGNASEFAEQLVALAARIGSRISAPALSMAGSDLVARVNALLNPHQTRGRSGIGYAVLMSVSAMALGTSVAAVEPVHRTIFERQGASPHAAVAKPQDQPSRRPPLVVRASAAQASTPAPSRPSSSAATTPAVQPPELTRRARWSQNSTATVAAQTDYVIGVGDVLTVMFRREKEMTADHVVRPDGRITLPLINDVDAGSLTPEQLRDRLMKAYERFLADETITVGVKAINSRKVYVIGGVQKPGAYELSGPMTVLQLISVAEGLRDFAIGKNIRIIRQEGGKQTSLPFDFREVLSGQNLGQNIVLRPGDTVLVPD